MEMQNDLAQEVHFLEVCYQIAKITFSERPLSHILKEICDLAVDVTGAERGSIMMVSKTKELRIVASKNVPAEAIHKVRIALDDISKVSGWVSKHKEPLLIENIMEDSRFTENAKNPDHPSQNYQTSSLVSVPLNIQRQFLGVFNITNKKNGTVFTQEDLRLMSHLADEIAAFIHHLKVTERLKQQALRSEEAYKQLLETDKLKKDLTNMIIHDLKAPLSEVQQSLSLYKEEAEESGKGDIKLITTSINSCSNLKELINDVLDIDRVESGACKLYCEEFNVLDIVEEAVNGLHNMFEEKGLSYEIQCDNEELEWVADVDFLQRILTNLLSNVYKYGADGKKVIIHIEEKGENVLEFNIEDFGRGIPKGQEKRVFEQFVLFGKGERGKVSSSGLGLAFCKLAVEAHGGKIAARNKDDHGCVFTFTLKKQRVTAS